MTQTVAEHPPRGSANPPSALTHEDAHKPEEGSSAADSTVWVSRCTGALLVALGASLSVLATVVVDRLGFSQPGFGPHERMGLQVGLIWIGVGASLLAFRQDLASRCGAEIHRVVRLIIGSRDLPILSGLCVIATVVGTAYVAASKGAPHHLFYDPTLPDPVHLPRIIPGMAFGLVIVLCYALCRLGMGRALASCCSLGLMSSPFHLYHLVPAFYRVYAKAPFLLAAILIMGHLVQRPMSRGWTVALAGLGGVIVGLGVAVREDLYLAAILFVMVLLWWLPETVDRPWRRKGVTLLVFLGSFLFAAAPVLGRMSPGHTLGPAIAGLSQPLNASLGLTQPAYNGGGPIFLDEMSRALPYAHAVALGSQKLQRFSWDDYDQVGRQYLGLMTANFPADLLVRVYAAVLKVLELPFTNVEPPVGVAAGWLRIVYAARAAVLRPLAGLGLPLAVIALLFISAVSVRRASFWLAVLVVLGGYPAVQFFGKHYFHLEFITWLTLGFAVQSCLNGVLRVARRDEFRLLGPRRSTQGWFWIPPVRQAGEFLIAVSVVAVAPLVLLRMYQTWHLQQVFKSYQEAPRQPLALLPARTTSAHVLFTNPVEFANGAPEGQIAGQMLMAEFGPERCSASTIWPVFRYSPRRPAPEAMLATFGPLPEVQSYVSWRPTFSQTMRIDVDRSAPTRVFFLAQSMNVAPVVGPLAAHFKGIELPAEETGCLRGLSRIENPVRLPVLMTAVLPSGGTPPYQTIAWWGTRRSPTVPRMLTPRQVEALLQRPRTIIAPKDLLFQANIVHEGRDGWLIEGHATPPIDAYNFPMRDRSRSTIAALLVADVSIGQVDTDLLRTSGRRLMRGSYFVAQGVLETGGVMFGLIKDGRAAGSVEVTAPGPFTIVLEAPEEGVYQLGLSNWINGYTSLENRVHITHPGWVHASTGG